MAQLNFINCRRKGAILGQIASILDNHEIDRDLIACLGSTMTFTRRAPYAVSMFTVDFFDGRVSIERNDIFTDAEAAEIRGEIQKEITSDSREVFAGGRKQRRSRKNTRKH